MGIIITYYINAMYFNVQYDSGDEGKKIILNSSPFRPPSQIKKTLV
jgi:hypothetical protein